MSNELKRQAGRLAAEAIEDGMLVGLGTGSTALHTIERLGERVRDDGLQIRSIATSIQSDELARKCGLEVVSFDAGTTLDHTIDGADEVSPDLHLVKGGGGALLREKVVAHRSRYVTIVADPSKLVDELAIAFPLPVEVVPFAFLPVAEELASLGGEPRLRQDKLGSPFVTDNGNWIIDVRFPDGTGDPQKLETVIDEIPGIVESGLFIGLANRIIIGRPGGPQIIEKKEAR